MKNTNGNETPIAKKLTIDDLKQVIGGVRPRAIDAEDSKGNKVHVE